MIQCFMADSEAVTDDQLERFQARLTHKEQKRLAGLKSIKRRREFIVGRMLVKVICAHHLNLTANQIEVGIRKNGAPFVMRHPDYFISLSHSDKYIMMALADEPVGIDIEKHKARMMDDLMPRVFPNHTPPDWKELDTPEKQQAFYTEWTRKEATYKLQSISKKKCLIYFKTFLKPDGYTTTVSAYNEIETDIKKVRLT